MRRRCPPWVAPVAALVVVGATVPVVALWAASAPQLAPAALVSAEVAVKACPREIALNADDNGGRVCFREALAETVASQGPAAAIEVVRNEFVNEEPPCHEVLHDLGRSAFLYLGDQAQVPLESANACGMGYVHGALEAMALTLDTSSFAEVSHDWCVQYAQSDEHVMNECQHGRGHALMRRTGGDSQAALPWCEMPGADRAPCRFGVIMEWGNMFEVAQGDPRMLPLPQTEPSLLCQVLEADIKPACYTMTVNVERGQGRSLEPYLQQCLVEKDSLVRGECVHAVSLGLVNLDRELLPRVRACDVLQDRELVTVCWAGAGYASTDRLRTGVSPEELCASLSRAEQVACVQGARRWLWEDGNGVLS